MDSKELVKLIHEFNEVLKKNDFGDIRVKTVSFMEHEEIRAALICDYIYNPSTKQYEWYCHS